MNHAHIEALETKHAALEKKIHQEAVHASADDLFIHKLKQERVYLKDEIERLRKKSDA